MTFVERTKPEMTLGQVSEKVHNLPFEGEARRSTRE